ncbi:MAG: hypothetical protein QXM46_03615 [Candidatus Hadarchaeales archaeon]
MEFKTRASLPFMALGALAGLLSGLASAELGSSSPALLLFLVFFFLAYRLTPFLLKLPPSQFPEGGWSAVKALKLGIWSFLACWLLVWILVYNLAL